MLAQYTRNRFICKPFYCVYNQSRMASREYITNNVSALRMARGYTQEGLADAVGVTRQTIIAMERGNYTPSVLLALNLAHFFDVPVEKVFTITYEK